MPTVRNTLQLKTHTLFIYINNSWARYSVRFYTHTKTTPTHRCCVLWMCGVPALLDAATHPTNPHTHVHPASGHTLADSQSWTQLCCWRRLAWLMCVVRLVFCRRRRCRPVFQDSVRVGAAGERCCGCGDDGAAGGDYAARLGLVADGLAGADGEGRCVRVPPVRQLVRPTAQPQPAPALRVRRRAPVRVSHLPQEVQTQAQPHAAYAHPPQVIRTQSPPPLFLAPTARIPPEYLQPPRGRRPPKKSIASPFLLAISMAMCDTLWLI